MASVQTRAASPSYSRGDVGDEVVHAPGHRAGEAVDGRALAEDRLEVDRRERRGVERPDALLQHERADERLLDGDLLVEGEADQQRQRLADEQGVGGVGVGEVEAVGHARIVRPRFHPARACR